MTANNPFTVTKMEKQKDRSAVTCQKRNNENKNNRLTESREEKPFEKQLRLRLGRRGTDDDDDDDNIEGGDARGRCGRRR